jgi:hypothetical protein
MVKKIRDKNVSLVNKRGGVGPLAKPSSGYALDSQSFFLKMVDGIGLDKGSEFVPSQKWSVTRVGRARTQSVERVTFTVRLRGGDLNSESHLQTVALLPFLYIRFDFLSLLRH